MAIMLVMSKGNIKINPPPPPVVTAPQPSSKYQGVKHTVLVMSGKGVVGKSTFSVNLSVTLAKKFKVGLIDADINGPDDPLLLGISKEKLVANEKGIIPASTKYGVKVISMAFMLPDDGTAVIWRGALRHKAIQQFLEDVFWDNADYVILDLPPGTGDEALTVSQLVPQADGIIIVITPQDVALLDARKALDFASKLKLNVIGMVENMSGFVCPHCGKTTNIFKSGGAEELCKRLGIPFLGRIPIHPEIVENGDMGIPAVEISDEIRKEFENITSKVEEILEK